MPETHSERARAHIKRKRAEARSRGLCGQCCKNVPDPDRVICRACHIATNASKLRKRKRDRAISEFRHIVDAHETAGDRAREHHLFDMAVQHYQDALHTPAIASIARERLTQKLGSISFFTHNPAATNAWRDKALSSYLIDEANATKAVDTLLTITSQMWIDSRTSETIPLREEAVRIAERHGTERLHKRAVLCLVNHLNLMGRFNEAADHLNTISVGTGDDLGLRKIYYVVKGNIDATRGLATEAYRSFESCVQCAKEDSNPSHLPKALEEYTNWAIALGDFERARALSEQALLIARRNHLGWYLPFLCMRYARLLAWMGRYTNAHGFVLEALASPAQAPVLEEHFALVGIPIALHLNDEALLAKCTRSVAVDLAFQSGEPGRIGPVVAAFARLYAQQGNREKCVALLHRALSSVTYVDESIDLPCVVAQYGAYTDLPAARALLEKRAQLPSADVAQACLLLFDSLVARRQKRRESVALATTAAEYFDRLHWYVYGDLARSIIPLPNPISTEPDSRKRPLRAALPGLTDRERQVVELVLEGRTNRSIAEQLNIREHTVEKHMTSIMNRLGIRSRYQLVDTLPVTSDFTPRS